MNWDQIEGNWKQFKGKVKQEWGKLTDDHLDVIEGKRDVLAGRLQERYGVAKDEAEREIDTWLKSTPMTSDAMATDIVIVVTGSFEERCAGACSVERAPALLFRVAEREERAGPLTL